MPHTSPPPSLPGGWSIYLRTALNLTILTLIDSDGKHREIGFNPLSSPGAPDRTVTTLEEITEPELRVKAQTLIDTHHQRTATARVNCEAFNTAVSDLSQLLNQLTSTASSGESSLTRARVTINDDTLTAVLTLTATGPAAAPLLDLTARWPRPTEAPDDGATQELDPHGNLTVCLDQTHAEHFLTWYRTQV
ncbi:hypothetical protein [Streptomyces sp. NPDC059819]|uniref:hypothetical protein n=1 Tax=Streptomyces sp. NPDC059819 TaxID=3346963 RepID=UPI003668F413